MYVIYSNVLAFKAQPKKRSSINQFMIYIFPVQIICEFQYHDTDVETSIHVCIVHFYYDSDTKRIKILSHIIGPVSENTMKN